MKNTGFVKAVELKIGDEVINSSGEVYKIENIRLEITEKPTTVYNFQVEDFHTYHVGNAGILVHNANANYGKRYNQKQSDLVKEGKKFNRRGSVTRAEAKDYVKRCKAAGLDAQIHEGHMSRSDPTIPMPGVSGKPHLHPPTHSLHIPIIG